MVLHFAGVNFVDSQGTTAVGEIVRLPEESGVELRLASVRPAVRAMLERDGVIDRLGVDQVHGSAHRAVAAHLSGRGAREDPPDEVPPGSQDGDHPSPEGERDDDERP